MQELLPAGVMPNLARIVGAGSLRRMNSVHPPVSSVAWASFMTGRNPAKHGIFGFIDRQPGSYRTFIPTGKNLRQETLWEILSHAGKRVIVMNVPMTYPPREVNGLLVGCFLSPNLEKATYPASLAPRLKEMGYRIDTDPWKARESKDAFLEDFEITLARRAEAAFHLMDSEKWDFFMLHIMETDRLHHFMWDDYDDKTSAYHPAFISCYRQIDGVLGQLMDRVGPDTELIILSDHGFCGLKKEVYLNHWLASAGYLKFTKEAPETLSDMHPESRAYSLDPGRVYINLRGREPAGCVQQGREYETLREELASRMLDLADPDSGERMVQRVLTREEAFCGELLDQAPDLVIDPYNGYDFKGAMNKLTLTGKNKLTGMHTYDDAMLYVKGRDTSGDQIRVTDVMPTILKLMDLPVPQGVDGRTLV